MSLAVLSGTESVACQVLAPRILSSVVKPMGHSYTGTRRFPYCLYAGKLSLPRTRTSLILGSRGHDCLPCITSSYFSFACASGNVHVPARSIRVSDVKTGLSSSMFWMTVLPRSPELTDFPTAISWLSIRIPRKVCSSRVRTFRYLFTL